MTVKKTVKDRDPTVQPSGLRERAVEDGSQGSFSPWKDDILPAPRERPGLVHRWIRTATYGESDNPNVSRKFRQGWVPVKASDYPEIQALPDVGTRFPDNIEIGGLLLCSMPAERLAQHRDDLQEKTTARLESVDRELMRQSDPRMPILRTEIRSRTTTLPE